MEGYNMRIEVWSDFACPFCYIGKVRLDKAIEKSGQKDVEIVYKSFLLDPTMDNNVTGRPVENLAKKYGQSVEKAQLMIDQIVDMAKGEGLEYDFINLKERNMVDAHRLLHLAVEKGLGDEVNERLFRAHLILGEDLSDYETLIAIGLESGLKREDIVSMYDGDKYVDEVQWDMNEAQDYGISSVPFFIIDRDRSIRGAQSVDIMVKELNRKASDSL